MPAPNYVGFAVSDEGVMTSIETTMADADAKTVYYNLNGQLMNRDNLPAGVYTRVCGDKRDKVVIRNKCVVT